MGQLYTSGSWTVVAGKEEEFVEAWRDLADWSIENIEGARPAVLMQDTEKPTRFLSFGPWDSAEAIERWRESDGFKERVGRIRELLEAFDPGTFESRAEAGEKG